MISKQNTEVTFLLLLPLACEYPRNRMFDAHICIRLIVWAMHSVTWQLNNALKQSFTSDNEDVSPIYPLELE